jgi:predicted lipoprotein with Yx(FWY)xxD motif
MAPRRRAVVGTGIALVLAGCGNDAGMTTADGTVDSPGIGTDETPAIGTDTGTEATATVQVGAHEEHGAILVDREGRTLYMFDQDTQGDSSSACTEECSATWPPLTPDGEVTRGEGVTAELDTFEREDGEGQVVANGWPLYRYAQDQSPGDTNGHGANDVWWMLGADGSPIQ